MSEVTQPPQLDEERQKLWAEFANEAFRLGQLTMQIEQTKGQIAKLEKEHEVALKKARGAADKHDKYISQKASPVAEAPEVTQ